MLKIAGDFAALILGPDVESTSRRLRGAIQAEQEQVKLSFTSGSGQQMELDRLAELSKAYPKSPVPGRWKALVRSRIEPVAWFDDVLPHVLGLIALIASVQAIPESLDAAEGTEPLQEQQVGGAHHPGLGVLDSGHSPATTPPRTRRPSGRRAAVGWVASQPMAHRGVP